jgi:hypothetical protein
MIKPLKNWLLQSKLTCSSKQGKLMLALFFYSLNTLGQVNYVNNPSFETITTPSPNFVSKLQFWNSLDTTQPGAAGNYYNFPNTPVGYCPARTGIVKIRTTFHCTPSTCTYTNSRLYPRNRLKATLTSGVTYCVKMYVSLQDICPYAIDALQIYFGDASMDTIKYCRTPLLYLMPQITNTLGIIGDTMNWVEVKNTFVATGNEKYLVIGCFKPDAAITRTNTGVSSGDWSEYFIDDVSVIDFNLSAYAGLDQNIFLGDSAFIGRPPEIGLDCTWSTGTVTVGDSAGIWVKPTAPGTYSYVVTQNICDNIKTDTVNVNVSPGFVSENELFAQSISLFPQPANENIVLSLKNIYENKLRIEIKNMDGKIVRDLNLEIRHNKIEIKIGDLADGIYFLRIENSTNQKAIKKLVIAK